MAPPVIPLEQRVWAKVARGADDECWEWQAAKNLGYGVISDTGRRGRQLLAHRVVYELLVGPIAEGLVIDHLCENRACVNPAHLEPVQHSAHMERHAAKRTHCKRGHLITGWRRRANGDAKVYRYCIPCSSGKGAERAV